MRRLFRYIVVDDPRANSPWRCVRRSIFKSRISQQLLRRATPAGRGDSQGHSRRVRDPAARTSHRNVVIARGSRAARQYGHRR